MIGLQNEDGTIDTLLLGMWSGRHERMLWEWREQTPGLHNFMPDYHRLCLEYWLWKAHETGKIGGRVADIGVIDRRDWIGEGYFTFGEPGSGCDVEGDLTLLFPSDFGGLVDVIICSEVLEHCKNPFQAVRRMHECLKPGGRIFITSPFIWPHHGTEDYRDYWRFTHEGWQLLLREEAGFRDLKITEVEWTAEGAAAYDQLRRWEAMGFRNLTRASTGYLCEAVK